MRALPPVDAVARLQASRLGQQIESAALRDTAAAAWAQRLECPVALAPLPPVVERPPSLPRACAGLVLPDGRAGVLSVDCAVLAGQLARLAGDRPRQIGPVPLSPAECGLFGFLALTWTGLLDPAPALDWIDSGARLWDPPRPAAALRWRVNVDGVVGLAYWWLPPIPPAPRSADTLRPDLPVNGRLLAGRAALQRAPRPGDLVVLHAAPRLLIGARAHPLARRADRWHVVTPKEARMAAPLADLPLTVDAVVGRLTLTVAEASALVPGAVLPLAPDPLPTVQLMVGDRVIAAGVLVDDAGRAAVQITRLVEASA